MIIARKEIQTKNVEQYKLLIKLFINAYKSELPRRIISQLYKNI